MKRPCLYIFCLVILLSLKIMVISLCAQEAKEKSLFKFTLKEKGPFTLKADSFKFYNREHILEARGHVLLTSKNYHIESDYARYNEGKHMVYMRGHIKALWGGDIIEAKELEVDVSSSLGWIREGEIFYAAPHLYFKGRYIQKTGENTYRFEDLTITGCDHTPPAWSFYVKKGELKKDGDAHLYHIKFNVLDHPILYFPYLQLPVMQKRKSGILIPEFISSSRDGTGAIIPYYWAISRERDMTFYPGFYSKRGNMFGIEYRATPDVASKMFLMGTWLHDKTYSRSDSQDFLPFQGDGLIRPNRNRYWIRGKMDSYLFDPLWHLKLDIDYASDQNFLREFDSGYLGFERSRNIFLSEFGRNINNKDSLLRTNTLLLSRAIGNAQIYLKMIYNENLAYLNDNKDPSQNPTVQTLPEIGINISKTSLPWGNLDFQAENTLDYFWRRYGDRGARLDLYPEISRTLNTPYATIIPYISFRETLYMLDIKENPGLDRFENRNIWETGLSASTELFRIYPVSKKFVLRHTLIPEIDYLYRPYSNLNNLPVFDSIDTISRANRITYSLTNIFTIRRGEQDPLYFDILRVKLEQSYDIEEAGRTWDLDKYPRRPFSDIRMDWDLSYPSILSLDGTMWFSPYIKDIVETETSAKITPIKILSLSAGYDWQRRLLDDIHRKNQEKLSVLKYGIQFLPSSLWNLSYEEQRDLVQDETIKRQIEMRYNHQCWSLDLLYTHTQDEDRIEFSIVLGSLGEVSQGVSIK